MTGIVSGGQTGVDRAALDAALAAGLAVGGWCPRGRWAEDGRIDDRYPLRETPLARVSQRTLWNIRDSDGTLVLTSDRPRGGTALTVRAAAVARPRLIVDPADAGAVRQAHAWLAANRIKWLNVGGPRASENAQIYPLAFRFVVDLIAAAPPPGRRHRLSQE